MYKRQRQDDDVKELKAKVQKQYEDAQTADPALAAFLDGLGEDVTGLSLIHIFLPG